MKKTTNLEIGSITYFLIRAYFIGITFNNLLNLTKQDSYISVFLGIIIGFIPLLAFFYIFNYEPDLSLNEKNKKLFGNVLGSIINITLGLFTFILVISVYSNLLTFIHSDYLNNTPTLLISIILMIAIFYALIKGIRSITRSCLILFYISIILVLTSNIGLFGQIDINNFKPILYSKTSLFNGIYSYIAYNVLPLYLLTIFPKNTISNNNKTVKVITIFYLIASLTLLLVTTNVLGIFGINLSLIYQYPEFQILKYVSLVGLSARLDSILFIQWMFDLLVFIIIAMYYLINTTHEFINEKKNIVLSIFSILIIIICEMITNNLFINFISLKVLPNIINITIIVIFLLILIKIKYTKKVKSSKSSNY